MISVNLSARQLHDRGVVEMVTRSLEKYGLPPETSPSRSPRASP